LLKKTSDSLLKTVCLSWKKIRKAHFKDSKKSVNEESSVRVDFLFWVLCLPYEIFQMSQHCTKKLFLNYSLENCYPSEPKEARYSSAQIFVHRLQLRNLHP